MAGGGNKGGGVGRDGIAAVGVIIRDMSEDGEGAAAEGVKGMADGLRHSCDV